MTELSQADRHPDRLDGADVAAPPARTPDASTPPAAPAADPVRTPDPSGAPRAGADTVRRTLWVLLVVLVSADAVVSLTTLPVVVGVALGLGALACAGALVARHLRGPR